MALPLSTANWHWRQKDVSPWAKAWMESQLTGVIFEDGKTSAKIDSVTSCEGDAEVGMRKSKLLTIYDLKVELKWSGVAADDENAVEGTITLPEVCHDVIDEDGDYQFETTLATETPTARKLYAAMRKHIPAFLKKKLSQFPADMLAAHGKDLKVEGTPSASGAATPVGVGAAATPANVAAKINTATEKAKTVKGLNTSTVKVDATFAVSSGDLFDLLTVEQKIMMWSRAAAKSTAKVDSDYSIFGGNIYGRYVEIQKPLKIVQTWTLKNPTWPDGHAATLTTTLNQGSDSTKVVFELAGVPTGQEDEIRNNLNGYYIRGFQSIGLGTTL
ncbi:hypothetical protein FRB94_003882 [Tulasnella sp. JGI-2019a]|nr:hypothetical protein FRB93_009208 [Tulasnella sp. JGI-2019a]KAG9013050.1 hypothetical protein FRB94_003882 [Tulasnella sp. JGI-2019a]